MSTALTNDAKNRAARTFLQGLAIDLAVAVAAFVLANVDSITDKQGLIVALAALGKTLVTTVASYVMRKYLDGSSLPTPLPPADPGEPDDDTPDYEARILGKAFTSTFSREAEQAREDGNPDRP